MIYMIQYVMKIFNEENLITSSAWRNDCGLAQGGVGMLVNNNAAKSLSKVKSRSNRILIIHFTPKTTVIVTY